MNVEVNDVTIRPPLEIHNAALTHSSSITYILLTLKINVIFKNGNPSPGVISVSAFNLTTECEN